MQPRALPFVVGASLLFACVGDTPTSPVPDAGGDVVVDVATSDASDGSTGFCDGVGTVALCEDFDHGALSGRGWASDPSNTLAPPTTASSPTKSPPFSLHSTSSGSDAAAPWSKLLKTVNVGSALTKSTLDVDVLVDTATFNGNGTFFPVGVNLSAGPVPVALSVSSTTWACFGVNKSADAGVPFPLKTWVHVTLLAQRTSPTTFDVTCTVEGKSVVVTGADGTAATADRRVPLGHNATGPMGQVDYYVDNVVLRAE